MLVIRGREIAPLDRILPLDETRARFDIATDGAVALFRYKLDWLSGTAPAALGWAGYGYWGEAGWPFTSE